MDRYSQNNSQHPADRPLMHDPNHHTPPTSFPPFHPTTAQPPVQIPFSDPFQTRDPFMPASQHSRRGSYGVLGASSVGNPYGERAWHGPPAHGTQQQQAHQTAPSQPAPPSLPPPPSNGPTQMPYSFESSRRRSSGGAGSPPHYVGGPLEPPPPPAPPSFAARNMPPPSPTSIPPASSTFPTAARGPPTASPFVGLRDLSGFSSRPAGGSNMSISALIGGDSSKPVNHSPRTNATAPSPTIKPIHPPSPQRARSASIRNESGRLQPSSPSRAQDSETLNDGRPASAAQALDRPVADHRAGPFPQHAPFAPGNAQLFRPYQSSPASTHEEHSGPHGHRVPPRPNSQPMHISQQEQEYRQRQEAQNRGVFHGFRQYVEQPAMPPAAPQGAPRADAPGPSEGPQRQGEGVPHPQDRSSHGLFSPRSSHASLPRGGFAAPSREDYTGLFRPAFHPYGHPSQPMGPNGAKESPDFRGSHEAHPRADHRPSPSPSEAALIVARSRQPTGPQVPPGMALYDTATQDPNFRRTEEPRSAFLGISPESNRRNGRASPLPQAVQGAQLRSVGPPGAPGVKSEFGRMFPGIGSGVGSATPTAGVSANGTTTPSRMSPAGPGDVAEAEGAPVGDAEGVQLSRGGSRSGRRTKKAREDGGKMDSDSAEGRETPASSQRGSKRVKTAHPVHHHHHHPIPHHHHHHHHNSMEEQMAASGAGGFNTLRFPSNPAAPQQHVPAATHHHHHHHATHAHPPHHHHHTPKPVPPPRQPTLSVSNQALSDSMATLPRKHLGSQVYDVTLSLPSNETTLLGTDFAFESTAKPIPRFEGKENCTFTVRVPRGYIGSSAGQAETADTIAGGLEEICKRRAIWGTDVYTDDSDVVAAAVHSGWSRGDFGEYNEDSHDLSSDGEDEHANFQTPYTITERPTKPVNVPLDADLHITVLILPPLEEYASTMRNNMRSRKWGGTHDGMSFMISSIDFVNEPKASRYSERTGAARRVRMREELERRKAAESSLGLLNGSSRMPVSV